MKYRTWILLIYIIILGSNTIFSQMEFPKTHAGKRAKDVLNFLNNDASSSTSDFISEANDAAYGSALVQIRNMSDQFTIAEIVKIAPLEISFILESESKELQFIFDEVVEAETPHKILLLRINAKRVVRGNNNTKQEPKPNLTFSVEDLNIFMSEIAEQNNFSGNVLVAKDGNEIFHKAYGFASKRFAVPNNLDTKFNLGSINKSFTAVAILQLVEGGKIAIDDPIGKYLDCFPNDISEKITIRQLLTMSSGWGDYWDNEYYLAHKDELRSVSEYMKFIKDIPCDFEPGSQTQHCNIGYEVAGAIIEKVSGFDYFDYIREHIYKPSDMENSDSFDRDGPVVNLAVGYTNQNPVDQNKTGYQWENTYILSPRGTPAGGGYSTTEDMLKYDQALRHHELIGKEYVNFMNKRYQGNIGDPYTPGGTPRVAGGAPGMSSLLARDLSNGYTLIVLSNYDFPSAMKVGNEILIMLGL